MSFLSHLLAGGIGAVGGYLTGRAVQRRKDRRVHERTHNHHRNDEYRTAQHRNLIPLNNPHNSHNNTQYNQYNQNNYFVGNSYPEPVYREPSYNMGSQVNIQNLLQIAQSKGMHGGNYGSYSTPVHSLPLHFAGHCEPTYVQQEPLRMDWPTLTNACSSNNGNYVSAQTSARIYIS
jgi:hypothetical protein